MSLRTGKTVQKAWGCAAKAFKEAVLPVEESFCQPSSLTLQSRTLHTGHSKSLNAPRHVFGKDVQERQHFWQRVQQRWSGNVSKPNPREEMELSSAFARAQQGPRQNLVRPILFCTGVSAIAFAGAAVSEERHYRQEWERWKSTGFNGRGQAVAPTWVQNSNRLIQNLYKEFWLDVSPVQRVVGSITAIHIVIFAALNAPSARLSAFMVRNFIHNLPPWPLKVITLLTANFAHRGLGHLAFNSIALWSFGNTAARMLGVDQFLGFYISAGLVSSLLSHLGRWRSLQGGLSLGASGAVYACFALTAMSQPDTEVALIFLPWYGFKIGDALNVMIAVDLAGAVLGWRRFDHFGHLGGALFGLYYVLRGQHEIWSKAQALADKLASNKEL